MSEPGRRPDERVQAIVIPLISVGVALLAVELTKRGGFLPVTIPAPSQVAASFAKNLDTVVYHLVPTLRAAAIGFLVAVAVALALATVATLVRFAKSPIYNIAVVTYSIPLLALSPVLVVWLGNGPAARITIAALAGFFPVIVGAIQGLDAIDRRQKELFDVLSASPLQRFWLLSVPSSLPFLFSGLKISAASAVLGAIVAEWAGAERGLGVMMAYALFAFNVEQVWLTVVTATLCAIVAYGVVQAVERLVVTWQVESDL
ncbi:ABC transporter permease [Reyranella sp.]|uniref:ABC transporter permease n=1 Tax=Reyranella sp. TaxID=1929291 RepID=UPI003BA95E30